MKLGCDAPADVRGVVVSDDEEDMLWVCYQQLPQLVYERCGGVWPAVQIRVARGGALIGAVDKITEDDPPRICILCTQAAPQALDRGEVILIAVDICRDEEVTGAGQMEVAADHSEPRVRARSAVLPNSLTA
jgi:hypothetical protein